MDNKSRNYLLKIQNQQEASKQNYQINIIKTELKQEKDIFNKYLISKTSTYSKISQINNSNIKKNQRERQILFEKTKDQKENNQKSSINKFKSSSLNKELNQKYKNIKINNNLNKDSETHLKSCKFVNIKDNINIKINKINKCASAHKTSYSKTQNSNKFHNKKQKRINRLH